MDIKILILEKKNKQYQKPDEYIYHGRYALQQAIFKLIERYFGKNKRIEVEEILKNVGDFE